MSELEKEIDDRIGEVRTDAVDLSFGEILNLHANNELIIDPEYQRLFRWSLEQRSRLIESVLLELPIPQLFVIENVDGVFELIDGLQRISSVFQFLNSASLDLQPLRLSGCELINNLNDKTFEDLPLSLRLKIRRSTVRTVVIKKQSKSFLRYEMFKRLNTGGSELSDQEVRNCSARMVGEVGRNFYVFIQDLCRFGPYRSCVESLSQSALERKADEELILRFFAGKNAEGLYRGNIKEWLDAYMESVIFGTVAFDYEMQRTDFERLFTLLDEALGPGAFVKYRNDKAIGALAPAYFEAVSLGAMQVLQDIGGKDRTAIRDAVIAAVQSEAFRENTGPGANSREKLRNRIQVIRNALVAA